MRSEDITLRHDPFDPAADIVDVPEEPFGIPVRYWKAGLLIFTAVLMLATVALLVSGGSPHIIGALYAIPAILFAYFSRRRGVLIVYLLSMYFFMVVVLFRYPSADDIFAAALRSVLLIAIALTVSYLTQYLLLEKRKYHAIFDNTENGVIVVNYHTRTITEMNQRFATLIGYNPTKEYPAFASIMPDQMRVDNLFSPLNRGCITPSIECTLIRCDGSRWDAVIVGRKIAKDHAVLTFIDITERRKMDEELRRCNADSNLYLDILTHDINNMNTAGLNYSRMIASRAGMGSDPLAEKLVNSLGKTDTLIRNISVLRQISATEPRLVPVQLGVVIRKEISEYPDSKIMYDGTDATVLSDSMLSSVFTNLIGNSLKFGDRDTRITIRVVPGNDEIAITVEDDGRGIPDAVKPIIFDRFRRGDTTVSGKGLGLFICKSLIERYGGTITVADRVPGSPDSGAAFHFTLKKA